MNNMNTIKIENDSLITTEIDSSIALSFFPRDPLFPIAKIKLTIKKDTKLLIEYTSSEKAKYLVEVEVLPGVCFQMEESREGEAVETEYRYTLLKDASMDIYKYHHIKEAKETDTVFLNGQYARMNYHLNTFAFEKEMYYITVHHNAPDTNCSIDNHALSVEEGIVHFYVTNIVGKGKKGCIIDQNSRIITVGNQESMIEPVLLIEENDIDASHSAHIGTFDEEVLFYLQSRGIPYKRGIQMLVKGFLVDEESESKEKVSDWIDCYWR